MRVVLKQRGYRQHEHYRGSGLEIPLCKARRNRSRVQHLDGELPLRQSGKSLENILRTVPDGQRGAQRRGKQKLLRVVRNHELHETALEIIVDLLCRVVLGHRRYGAEVKALYKAYDLAPAALPVADEQTSVCGMDLRRQHERSALRQLPDRTFQRLIKCISPEAHSYAPGIIRYDPVAHYQSSLSSALSAFALRPACSLAS